MKIGINRSQRGTIIRFGLSVILLVVLFSMIDREHFTQHILLVNPAYYALALAVFFGFVAMWAARWYFILHAAGEQISFRRVFTTTLVGNFFAMFLPEIVGSDLARMSEVSDDQRPHANIVSTVLLDRVIGLVSIILMALIALPFGSQFVNDSSLVFVIGGLLVAFIVGWILFFNRRFMEWCFGIVFRLPLVNRFESSIRSLYEALYALHRQPRMLIGALALSLVTGMIEVLSIIVLAHGSGGTVPPVYFFIFLPVIWLITTIPISISGLGVREGAFAFFFTQVEMASEEAVALSLLYYSLRVITGLVGGLIFLRGSFNGYLRKRRSLETASPA